MNIEITATRSEGLERRIAVRVPVEAVRDAEDRAARRYASSARLPGFRPGKAPPAVIKKRFREEIRQQVIEDLVQVAYREVLDREQLKIASQPHIHGLTLTDGEPMTFELHVEVRPEVTLERTHGFRIARPAADVSEERVRQQIDELRNERATWNPVEERPQPGDMATVLLATADENGEMPEGREVRLVLGAGRAIPGIEELIMELTPGTTVQRPVRWPDDFPDEAQRGQSKMVRVMLQDVKRKSLPPLDDAFAGEVGDFESLAALEAAVRSDLQENAGREADAAVRAQILDEIANANPFDVPPSWVVSLLDAYVEAYQVPEDQQEQFRQQFRPVAERQVRRDLILETLADREQLRATEADIDERVSELAQKRNANPAQIYASLQKAGRLKEIERALTEDRVFAWLQARNEIDGVPPTVMPTSAG
jgi:trigger factor